MKKYFIPLFLSLSIIFYSFVPQVAFAYTSVAPTPSIAINSAKMLPLLAPFAPQVALIALVCIGGGIVFENKEEIAVVAGGIYQKMVSAGQSVSVGALGVLSLGVSALSNVNLQIGQLIANHEIELLLPTQIEGVFTWDDPIAIDGMYIPYGSTLSGGGGSFVVPVIAGGIGYSLVTLETWVGASQPTWKFVYDGVASSGWTRKTPAIGYVYYPQTSVPIPDSSISADIPSSMISTPSSTPYVADTAISIPTDYAIDSDASIPLLGVNDWTIPYDYTLPVDVPVDVPVDMPLDWSIPSAPVALNFAPLKGFDLTNKFPFSIPWDIKNSFTTLVAPSVAPTFDIDMTKWLGGTHYIIKFSMFDKLASILRWGLLMIFNIGLIIKTRSIIRG